MCIWPQRGVTTTEHSVTHWFAAVTIAVTAQVAALWCRRCCNCGVRMLSSSCLSVRCLGCGGGWLTGLLLLSLGVLPRCRSWFSATWCRKSYRLRQLTCWSSGCGVCVCVFYKKGFWQFRQTFLKLDTIGLLLFLLWDPLSKHSIGDCHKCSLPACKGGTIH